MAKIFSQKHAINREHTALSLILRKFDLTESENGAQETLVYSKQIKSLRIKTRPVPRALTENVFGLIK